MPTTAAAAGMCSLMTLGDRNGRASN
jgi:hypothetical protein